MQMRASQQPLKLGSSIVTHGDRYHKVAQYAIHITRMVPTNTCTPVVLLFWKYKWHRIPLHGPISLKNSRSQFKFHDNSLGCSSTSPRGITTKFYILWQHKCSVLSKAFCWSLYKIISCLLISIETLIIQWGLGPPLLTWINLNLCMGKWSHSQSSVGIIFLAIPKSQFWNIKEVISSNSW